MSTSQLSTRKAIVLSPAWPAETNGSGIAIRSALQMFAEQFREVCFIGLVETPFDKKQREEWQKHCPTNGMVRFHHVKITRYAPLVRFLLSYRNALPAVTHQFHAEDVKQKVFTILKDEINPAHPPVFIIEDIPIGSYWFDLKQRFRDIPVIVRSENVAGRVFETIARKSNPLERLLWEHEIRRLLRLEEMLLRSADRFWAISDADFNTYEQLYQKSPAGVFGVCLDADQYQASFGDISVVIHLGGADLRKGRGLAGFIERGWTTVRKHRPDATLLLAGKNSQKYAAAPQGVWGLGFIDDVQGFLGRGSIFINPQESGSGIKLKSLVALLAGKTLISTEIGIEGVAGTNGVHFLSASSHQEMGEVIVTMMSDPGAAAKIGRNAREMAAEAYSQNRLRQDTAQLFADIKQLA
ncbi:glycosyltransferase [Candidatus Chloroploca sp. M-50]|uniref:Glycosyltransferase n=1 Tax=Candidatus Chloroploca mongolica TaxID=2528176 RepID=A0ABS4D8I0_9CHLR|nr:glycosyltransferase [Candidatus Chloroploca mongolica]MBP1465738.1 glycosyltransferase [Candidatus Chloroploca mongolica]